MLRNAACLALVVASLGCRAAPPPPVALDLVEALPDADWLTAPSVIDFGTEQARPYLGGGWSWHEQNEAGATYTWAIGAASELALWLPRTSDLTLVARLLPFEAPGLPAQTLAFSWNGQPVETITLRAGMQTYRIEVPAEVVRAGANRLRVSHGRHQGPGDLGLSNDPRPLAVAWDLLRIEREGATATVAIGDPNRSGPGDTTLRIAAGTEIAYHVPSGVANTVLAVEGVGLRGEVTMHAVVSWDGDGQGAPVEEVVVLDGDGRTEWPLPDGPPDRPVRVAVRVSASAVNPETSSAWRGAVLKRPRLLGHAQGGEVTGAVPLPVAESGPVGDIVLFLVDTLRADRLGCYGQVRPLSPRIDALAARGVVFEQARAETSWTKPATASLLTGLGPLAHGVHDPTLGLSEETTTLAERLRDAGYRTGAFVASAHITEASGFAQGFDHFDLAFVDAETVVDRALAWLDAPEQRTGRPAFVFLHVVDPHGPFEPPPAERARFAATVVDPGAGSQARLQAINDRAVPLDATVLGDLWQLYDAEVAYTDRQLGRLVDGLVTRDRFERALVAVTADHGEAFWERRVLGHGWDLYQEVTRVPLVLRLPGDARAAERVSEPAALRDVVPTILAQLGRDAGAVDGRDLFGSADVSAQIAYLRYGDREAVAVFDGRFEWIGPLSTSFAAGPELYDLANDAEQRINRVLDLPVRAGYLASLGRRALRAARTDRAPQIELDPELRARLRALGYLDG